MTKVEDWLERLEQDLRLRDYRARTRQSYVLSVRQLVRYFDRSPCSLSEDDLRRYALHLRDERRLAPSTQNTVLCGLRFFFKHTLRRGWPVFDVLRVHRALRLPVVLSVDEVRATLSAISHPVHRMALTAIYALGLRVREGLQLRAEHIDAHRMCVTLRDGKGARDRSIPLPHPLLWRLRAYWRSERPPAPSSYLFPGATGVDPLHPTTLAKALRVALRRAAIAKAATIHTLRHSYATHLLEDGVSIRAIQEVLGHGSLQTTSIYLHVTRRGVDRLRDAIDALLDDLELPLAPRPVALNRGVARRAAQGADGHDAPAMRQLRLWA